MDSEIFVLDKVEWVNQTKISNIDQIQRRSLSIVDLGEGSLMIIVCTNYCNSREKIVSDGCISKNRV